MAPRKKNTDNDGASDNETQHSAPGAVTKTTEGSHEIVSYGDGTGRERPIVNASGEYPPRPSENDED